MPRNRSSHTGPGDPRDDGPPAEPSKAGRARLSASTIYDIIRTEGESELRRPATSLWWSGFAAGIAISLSVVGEGLLYLHLPDGPFHHALSSLGYTLGFLLAVIGRLQLFTENTVTAVLPCLARTTPGALGRTGRLWGIVFAANMVGAAFAVAVSTWGGLATPEQQGAYTAIGRPILEAGWLETAQLAVPAGFMIAAMVWLMPNARGFEIWIVAVLTYFIALGDYSHVIAGAVEVFHLYAVGETDAVKVVGFVTAAFVGNVIGGTGLFALLAYGQVRKEIDTG